MVSWPKAGENRTKPGPDLLGMGRNRNSGHALVSRLRTIWIPSKAREYDPVLEAPGMGPPPAAIAYKKAIIIISLFFSELKSMKNRVHRQTGGVGERWRGNWGHKAGADAGFSWRGGAHLAAMRKRRTGIVAAAGSEPMSGANQATDDPAPIRATADIVLFLRQALGCRKRRRGRRNSQNR